MNVKVFYLILHSIAVRTLSLSLLNIRIHVIHLKVLRFENWFS